jgi:uncharacterized membrane protein YoaK (UPF0700 family)
MSTVHNRLNQWFPIFFHLHTPWQPISINRTLHISSTTYHNIHLISHLLTCTSILSCTVDICASFCHYSIFFCIPLNVLVHSLGVCIRQVENHWPKSSCSFYIIWPQVSQYIVAGHRLETHGLSQGQLLK